MSKEEEIKKISKFLQCLGWMHREDGVKRPSFVEFCDFIKIPHKDKPGVTFSFCYENWYPEQKAFEANRTGKDVVLKPRQIGFTTIETVRDLWFALCRQKIKVKIVAQNNDVAKSILRDIRGLYQILHEEFTEYLPSIDKKNEGQSATQTRLILFNGSEISCISAGANEQQASKIRSGAAHRLHLTEVAFWACPEVTIQSIYGQITSEAEVVYESTPKNFGDYFYSLCEKAKTQEGFNKFHFYNWLGHASHAYALAEGEDISPQTEQERLLVEAGASKEQLKYWRYKVEEMGEAAAKTEYPLDPESCFMSTTGMFLDEDIRTWLDSCSTTPEVINQNGLRISLLPEDGMPYVIGADVGGASGRDNSAFVVMNANTHEVAAVWYSNKIKEVEFSQQIAQTAKLYNNACVVVEQAFGASVVLDRLQNSKGIRLYSGRHGEDGGWKSQVNTRPLLFACIRDALKTKPDIKMDKALVGELKTLSGGDHPAAVNKGKHSKASQASPETSGVFDDLVISYGLCLLIAPENTRTSRRMKTDAPYTDRDRYRVKKNTIDVFGVQR